MERTEITPLTGLRAVAALYVFFFHMQIRWPFAHESFISNLLGEGAIGMSIFFVLSGFVLAYQYSDRRISYREYVINRFARIYPIYAVVAVLSLPWIGLTVHDGTIIRDLARIVTLILTNALLIQAWFPQFFPLWNDGASWSISVEMFCYALLPLVLIGLARLDTKRLIAVALVSIAAGSLPGITHALFENSPSIFYAVPIYRLPEFLIGVCSCLVIRRGMKMPGWMVGALLGACTVYLGVTPLAGSIYVSHNWIVLPTVAACVMFLSHGGGVAAKLMATRVFVYLGHISYCIYSLQAVIILTLIGNHHSIVARAPAFSSNAKLMLASLVVLIAASAAAHHCIEEPARKWIKRRYGNRISAKSAAQNHQLQS